MGPMTNRSPHSQPTIFALSSAPGRAGIAVIRVSGTRAGQALTGLAGALPEARSAALATLRDPRTGEALDRALVIWFEGPNSFTGEDVAEFHIHGGRAVIDCVVSALARIPGFRPAEAGEFARRAFDNGKLDLTAIEGLADLINAETQAQRRQALRQTGGHLGALYGEWREAILSALAHVEAELDFSDESGVPNAVEAEARPIVEKLAIAIADHLDDRHRGERLRDGFRVLIAGTPNAGKSSLLNVLAQREAAIVSHEAGTTRDVIEVHLDLGGLPIVVMDTAGICDAAQGVEQEGIRRTFQRAEDADLIIWLVDAAAPKWHPPCGLVETGAELLTVVNKIDLQCAEKKSDENFQVAEISVKNDVGVGQLTDALYACAARGIVSGEAPAITRQRHRIELEWCTRSLASFLNEPFDALELRAEDLRASARALGRITGHVNVEDVLERIFSEFCIGK